MKRFVLKWRSNTTRMIKTATVTVDDGDAHILRNKIYRVKNGCVIRTKNREEGEVQFSHDLLGAPPKGHCWVHKDGNSLNCVRSNFECVSRAEASKRIALKRWNA